MSSKEDYLDDLLKDLEPMGLDETASDNDILNEGNAILEQMDLPLDGDLFADMPEENLTMEGSSEELLAMEQEPITMEVPAEENAADSLSVESFANMSEEEIDKLLSMEQDAEQSAGNQNVEAEKIDLMDILEQSDDGDLQEIHDLLQKSDNNEAIVENPGLKSEEVSQDYMNLLGEISGESQGEEQNDKLSEREKKAQERRGKREERKAAREANKQAKLEAKQEAKAAKETEKEAKRAEKEARKEAKKAEKEAKKVKEQQPEDNNVNENLQEQVQPVAEDDLADIEALLSLAGGDNESSDDPFGVSIDSVLPFVEADDIESIDDAFEPEESVVLVKKGKRKDSPKKGWFARFIEFITEEDEEEEAERGNENVQISDENKNIIDDMDKKKKKKKKNKKGKGGADEKKESAAEGENTEEGAEEDKKAKKKKAKKEKVPAEMLEEAAEGKKDSKITFKRVMPIALVCLSIGVVIVLLADLSGDYSVKKAGRKAYYEGDYQTCYQNLYGKELNESEQVMYSKSESILRMRLWFREYELLVEEGTEPEALDSLLESVKNYPSLYSYASEWNAGTDVAEIYAKMLNVLSEKYHLTEEQALEIATTQNDVEYSKKVYAIVDGAGYGSWDEQPQVEEESLQDVLPEEEELGEILFMENSGK